MADRAPRESDVLLSDGRSVHVRPARADDAEALGRFHAGLSRESVYLRYFSAKPRLSRRFVEHFTQPDEARHLVLFAWERDEIIAMASYDRLGHTDAAAVAFCVADAARRRGLAATLFDQLVGIARENGIRRFVADTLTENRAMRQVLETSGFELKRSRKHGVIQFSFPIEPTRHWVARLESREHRSEAISVAALLQPQTLAVVATTDSGEAARVLARLRATGYPGTLYSVSDGGEALSEIADDLDLVVADLPAGGPADLISRCARLRTRGVILVGEAPGEVVDARLVADARRRGIRLIGPRSLGLVNTDPARPLFATAADPPPESGPVGLVCESAAAGRASLEALRAAKLGISSFVSLGDRSDLSSNDVLQFFEDDAATRIVAVHVESLGNPRKFARIARRLARRKPVLAVASASPRGPSPALAALGVTVVDHVEALAKHAREWVESAV